MTSFKAALLLTLFAAFLFSCEKKERQKADTSDIKMDLAVENVDSELFACKSKEEVQQFLNSHAALANIYFAESQIDPSRLAEHLFGILQNPAFRNFKTQLDTLIGDRKQTIVTPLTDAFKQIRHHYPSFAAPKIAFMISGFVGSDLYISDSLIIIGLDYFGGPKAKYRPDVFDYQLTRYQREYIVPSIVFFESNRYNRTDPSDKTLLGDMIGYGKGYEFAMQILPDTPDSLILGYSAENLRRTSISQQEIWSYFIAGKLLYEKNDLRKKKFIDERPFTTEIGAKVPGAIARWLGWRIVSKYVKENPDITLPELMQTENAARILQESGYKGQADEDE